MTSLSPCSSQAAASESQRPRPRPKMIVVHAGQRTSGGQSGGACYHAWTHLAPGRHSGAAPLEALVTDTSLIPLSPAKDDDFPRTAVEPVAPLQRVAPDADTSAGEHEAAMDTIVALCKKRGLIFQSSEIYDGLRGAWDYGPLGAALKETSRRPGSARCCSCVTTWCSWTPPSSCTRACGRRPATSQASPTRWWSAAAATRATAPTSCRPTPRVSRTARTAATRASPSPRTST